MQVGGGNDVDNTDETVKSLSIASNLEDMRQNLSMIFTFVVFIFVRFSQGKSQGTFHLTTMKNDVQILCATWQRWSNMRAG